MSKTRFSNSPIFDTMPCMEENGSGAAVVAEKAMARSTRKVRPYTAQSPRCHFVRADVVDRIRYISVEAESGAAIVSL